MIRYFIVVGLSLLITGAVLYPLITQFREFAHVDALDHLKARASLSSIAQPKRAGSGLSPSELLTYEAETLPHALWTLYYLNGIDGARPSITASSSQEASWSLGAVDAVPVAGDYNGDGVLDLAGYRPGVSADGLSSARNWVLYFAKKGAAGRARYADSSRNPLELLWGSHAAIAVPADYDGDGAMDVAVFEAAAGIWQLLFSSGGFNRAKAALGASEFGESQHWGRAGDAPLPADYNGDGCADLAVIRREDKHYFWHIFYRSCRGSKAQGPLKLKFGAIGDMPLAGDFDGDGRIEPAVYRPSLGRVAVRFWSGKVSQLRKLAKNGRAFSEDFDGDGISDPAVFTESGKVIIRNSSVRGRVREILRGQSPANTALSNFLPAERPAAVVLREHQLSALWVK